MVRTDGATWPRPKSLAAGIVVRFASGFGPSGSDVPQDIRHAILMTVAHWYENREMALGTGDQLTPPVRRLLAPYRKLRL